MKEIKYLIALEPFTTSDFDRLINWIDSEELMIQFGGPLFNYPITYDQLHKYVKNDHRIIYKVVEKASGSELGHAALNDIDYQNKNARICSVLVGEKT